MGHLNTLGDAVALAHIVHQSLKNSSVIKTQTLLISCCLLPADHCLQMTGVTQVVL